MEFSDIIYEVRDGIGYLTLNKPEKLNAASWRTWGEIEHAIKLADADDGTKVVIITGAGRGFCAGTDLTGGANEGEVSRPFPGREGFIRSRYLGPALIYRSRKPVIAAVNGACVGAGFSLALGCDIRVASEAARFSAIFVKRGLSADTGTSWFLPRLVGLGNALEILYTGKFVDAQTAYRIGLVNDVAPPDQLMERAEALARQIASGPSVAIELNKRLAIDGLSRDLESHVLIEEAAQAINSRTEDVKEGRLSFIEGREPKFQGR